MLKSLLLLPLFFIPVLLSAQGWKLELRSSVELRTWKLTDKSESSTVPLSGASIKLMKGNTVVAITNSDANGNFLLLVPPNDEFIGEISFSGCVTKRFLVSTKDVPDFGEELFKPSFKTGAFILHKSFQGVDYSGLQQPLLKIVYSQKIKNFDADDASKQQGIQTVTKINTSENALIEQFCSANKQGNEAMKIPDCLLAKKLYEKAMTTISGEQYPMQQMAKVTACLKEKEIVEKKAKEAAAKAEAERIAKEKTTTKVEEKVTTYTTTTHQGNTTTTSTLTTTVTTTITEGYGELNTAAKKDSSKVIKETTATTETKNPMNKPETKSEIVFHNTGNTVSGGAEGKAHHKVDMVIGEDKHTAIVKQADDYFKMKRYKEAKEAYQEALKLKASDKHAINRLAEIEKLETK